MTMDSAGLTRLLIRIAGMLSIAFAVGDMPVVLERVYDSNQNAPWVIVAGAVGSILPSVLIGAILFVMAGPITNRVFDRPADGGPRPELVGIESAALFVLGCYLLAYAILDAVYLVAKLRLYYAYIETNFPSAPSMIPNDFAQLCRTIVKFVLALGLIFFSRGVVALKDRMLSMRGPLHKP
jgi:hypothetical protein